MDVNFLSLDFVIYAFLASTALGMFRVVVGPSRVDRLTGLNVVSAQVLAILILIAVKENLSVYLDVALVYDIFGFLGILAITKFLSRKGARG
jgi:multicomponent Na+:H+ antiporter subunit F